MGTRQRGSYPGEVGAAVGLGTEGRRGCYGAFAAAAKAARGRRVWLSKGKRKKKCRGRERENGEEGAGPGLKHGKVAARARQVAASAAQASQAVRTASKVTTLFRNFKILILPHTYH